MVSPYLKNKGSAVRFCLWPQVMNSNKKIFLFPQTFLVVFITFFINRGVSTKSISSGEFYQNLANNFPDLSNNPIPHRILLPFLSWLTKIPIQYLNILFTILFIFLLLKELNKKFSATTSVLFVLSISTTMVVQFTLIYGGYPDIFIFLVTLLVIIYKDTNYIFFILCMALLLTREGLVFIIPYLFLTRDKKNLNDYMKLITTLLLFITIYLFLEPGGSENGGVGWKFFLEPVLNNLKFWATQNKTYFFLGVFSSVKFLWLLFIYQIIELKEKRLLLFFLLFMISLQFLFVSGDTTRYWYLIVIGIIFSFNYLKAKKVLPILLFLIIILNIITPKYYVFNDGNGVMYTTPNDSRIHFFDIYKLLHN